MGSGGPSNTTSTTTTRLPPYAQGPAKKYIQAMQNQVLPGGQVGSSPLPYQQIAPLTGQQVAGMQDVSAQAPGAQGALNAAQAQQSATAAGDYLSAGNPYLSEYFNAAAAPMIANYQTAVAPNIVADAVRSGNIGSTGEQASFANAQTALAQGLGNLGANIYEPAYMGERQLQQSAAQGAPAMASGQFIPAQQLAASGQTGQQQAQNILDAARQNLTTQAMWPYQDLGYLGQAIGQSAGGGGNQVTVGPNPAQGMK